jgi:hypothetical protein
MISRINILLRNCFPHAVLKRCGQVVYCRIYRVLNYKTINFRPYEYYEGISGIEIVDIGPSTENSP